jgi:hypothetical protein
MTLEDWEKRQKGAGKRLVQWFGIFVCHASRHENDDKSREALDTRHARGKSLTQIGVSIIRLRVKIPVGIRKICEALTVA